MPGRRRSPPGSVGCVTRGFGIIGVGTIGAVHAEAIALLPDARLTAVTDVAAGPAEAFAAARGCAAEPTLDALLARPDVDVVCVCVPSGLHAEVGVRAARAGKHVAVEKPLDVTLEAADRLLAAVREAGVSLTVMSQHRFNPGVAGLKRMIDSGALGRPLLGEAVTKWYRTQAYYDSSAWRGTRALDGGALLNQGIHYADLLLWCLGPASEVTAVTVTQAHDIEAEDTALAIVRFASGAVGTLSATTAAYPGFPQRLEITGTEGTATVEDGRLVRAALRSGDAGPAPATTAGAAADPGALDVGLHAAQLADLLAAVDEGRPPAVTGDAGRETLALVLAVYESARAGHPVRLGS
jgi:UDP-N-acetyl-2-amino-2-deoxyglucuronate dehydrogenase